MKSPIAVTILLLLLAGPAGAATLKIATLAPDGTHWMKTFRKAARAIKEETNGRVRIRYYPGGVMGDDKSILRKIRIGQLHGGALSSGGMANVHPDSQIYSIPFAFDNYREVDHVRQELDGLIQAQLLEAGFVSYGISEGGFAYMMSRRPITNLAEAKRSKVWVPEGDPVSRIALESLGISPVPLPLTDVLTGLQTGLIDTVSAPPTGAIALQWHTKVKHLANSPLLYTYGTLVISNKALRRISDSDRKLVRERLGSALQQLNLSSRKDNQSAFKALRKQEIRVNSVDNEEIVRWRARINPAIASMHGDKAISPELLQRLHRLIDNLREH